MGLLELLSGLNGKKGPTLIALAIFAQTIVQVFAVRSGQEEAVKKIISVQAEQTKAVNSLSTYIKEGVLTKAEAGYLWRKREREEIAPMHKRIADLERREGLYQTDYRELSIDLPNWNEDARPPIVWLEDKAGGRE